MHTLCRHCMQTLCRLKSNCQISMHPVCKRTLYAECMHIMCILSAYYWVYIILVIRRLCFGAIEMSCTSAYSTLYSFLDKMYRKSIWLEAQAHLVHTFLGVHAHHVQTIFGCMHTFFRHWNLKTPPSQPSFTNSLRITLSLNGPIPSPTFLDRTP